MATAALVKEFDFELFHTDRKDVDFNRDGFVGFPVKNTKGVRVIVKAEKD